MLFHMNKRLMMQLLEVYSECFTQDFCLILVCMYKEDARYYLSLMIRNKVNNHILGKTHTIQTQTTKS